MKRSLWVALLLSFTLVFSACSVVEPTTSDEMAEEAPTEMMEEATPEAEEEMAEDEMVDGEAMNIVETAAATEGFSTLVAAVEAAGLVETLSGEGPFTVFAPTDDAFAALPEGTVATLLEDPSGDLTQILTYHVVAAEAMAADVTDGLELETVQGSPVTFTVADDGSVMINEATIVTTDIVASNGVIHVIDAVLMPPAE